MRAHAAARTPHRLMPRPVSSTHARRRDAARTDCTPAVSMLVVVSVTLLAASNLIRVYGSASLWARAAAPACLLGALAGLMGSRSPSRARWRPAALAACQWIVGPMLCLSGTTTAHGGPAAVIAQGWRATFGSFKTLIAVPAPVGEAQGALMAAWTLCLWTTALAGCCALARDRRWCAAADATLVLSFAASAALGDADGWMRANAGTLGALMLVAWTSWRLGLLEARRVGAAALIMALAAAGALGACASTRAHRDVLRDHYEPPTILSAYASPLSAMRAYVKEHRDDTLLTVRGLPAGTPVRLAVMDRFDGVVWNLSQGAESTGSANYARVGERIGSDARGTAFTARFSVHASLSGPWLPLAGSASAVRFDDETLAGSFLYNADTACGLLVGAVGAGLDYVQSGVAAPAPDDGTIARTRAARVAQPAAERVPASIGAFATAVAGGLAHDGETAQALARALREHGWFSHGLASDYPSAAGHGAFRLDLLLSGPAMVGDDEQYASAMALMARELGLPSRVVFGFLPKDASGAVGGERAVTREERPTVEFTGDDVAAWVEIDLEGLGWTAFHPTPPRTKTPDETLDLTPPDPRTLVVQPPVPLVDPPREERRATGRSSIGGDDAPDDEGESRRAVAARVARTVVLYGSPVWAALALGALLLATKAAQLAWLRRHGTPARRVDAGWRATLMLARQIGVDARGTRREQARLIARELRCDARPLAYAAREADRAAFSGEDIDETLAEAYWSRVDEARATMLRSLPWARRWRARLSPRAMRAGRRPRPPCARRRHRPVHHTFGRPPRRSVRCYDGVQPGTASARRTPETGGRDDATAPARTCPRMTRLTPDAARGPRSKTTAAATTAPRRRTHDADIGARDRKRARADMTRKDDDHGEL